MVAEFTTPLLIIDSSWLDEKKPNTAGMILPGKMGWKVHHDFR